MVTLLYVLGARITVWHGWLAQPWERSRAFRHGWASQPCHIRYCGHMQEDGHG